MSQSSKEFSRTLSSYMDTRQVLKLQLRDLSNLKTQTTYADLSTIDNLKQSVSSSRLQAKNNEDIEVATAKFKNIQKDLVQLTHDLVVHQRALEAEVDTDNVEDRSDGGLDLKCARTICHDIQQQSLLELCLSEKLCAENLDNDVLVTISQCFAQEVYMNTSLISDVLSHVSAK
mmetsp:Transcript_7447/g.12510  ORF Transcript_7447/g.12510 Transcript_7447/m.12510 type:complete len:174 (+) Transcript_7447:158-679(+)